MRLVLMPKGKWAIRPQAGRSSNSLKGDEGCPVRTSRNTISELEQTFQEARKGVWLMLETFPVSKLVTHIMFPDAPRSKTVNRNI
jgi:hypothetical protein